ncbi:hypothetical protein GCM10009546_34940 [Actinomadura livida]|uniref:Uncharacterized protein n=1 Tax=Actinomadura livida TaxID=79909 RepID=A0ABN1ELY8_9ACTN
MRPGQEIDWTSEAAALEVGGGWELELGTPPPQPAWFVVLPFVLLWPPVDAEEHDDEEEDDLDEEYPDVWERLPDAGHTEFEAEFLRVRAMVEKLIGPPGVSTATFRWACAGTSGSAGRRCWPCTPRTTSPRTRTTTGSRWVSGTPTSGARPSSVLSATGVWDAGGQAAAQMIQVRAVGRDLGRAGAIGPPQRRTRPQVTTRTRR